MKEQILNDKQKINLLYKLRLDIMELVLICYLWNTKKISDRKAMSEIWDLFSCFNLEYIKLKDIRMKQEKKQTQEVEK